jgi:hypothetical protein
MINKILTIIAFLICSSISSQVIIVPTGLIGASLVPEHGFLPGKKFMFYPTLVKYKFHGRKFRVEIFDDRQTLNLSKIQCSDLEFTNTSEFASPNCIYRVKQYIDTIFLESSIIIDTSAIDTIKVRLEGIDARIIGYGYVRVHGLCQMKLQYKGFTKTYCIDITDKDQQSPISSNSFVTRLTATRIMVSVAMREIIEQILFDLKLLE